MKKHRTFLFAIAASCAGLANPRADAAIVGYWPINETSGTTTANIPAGNSALLNGDATFVTDPTRGQVLQFTGAGYVDAGTVPQQTLTNDFTWAFWVQNQTDPVVSPNVVIVGNRYNGTSATDFIPREFTKFTTTKF